MIKIRLNRANIATAGVVVLTALLLFGSYRDKVETQNIVTMLMKNAETEKDVLKYQIMLLENQSKMRKDLISAALTNTEFISIMKSDTAKSGAVSDMESVSLWCKLVQDSSERLENKVLIQRKDSLDILFPISATVARRDGQQVRYIVGVHCFSKDHGDFYIPMVYPCSGEQAESEALQRFAKGQKPPQGLTKTLPNSLN